MPNRILREGILTSERVNTLGFEAEVFYRRLMSVVDDYGRFAAHPSLLRAALFPLKLNTVADHAMERLLEEVVQAGLVRVYEVEGKRYLELCEFRQQIRAKVSKYPDPPGSGAVPAARVHAKPQASAHLGEGEGVVVVVVEDESEGGAAAGAGAGAGAGAANPPSPPPVAAGQGIAANGAGETCAAPPGDAMHTNRQTQTGAAPPLHVQLAVRLREAGVNITSAHPLAHSWAARGLSVEHALEAFALARTRKPHGRIAANYLAPIMDDMLNPKPGAHAKGPGKATAPPAWWSSEAATVAKGRELGLNARPGEAMAEYRARLSQAIARNGDARG